jgi:hypothetical protein
MTLARVITRMLLAPSHMPVAFAFCWLLLDHFDGSYEGEIKTYLGCEIERDMVKDTTSLSQKRYAEEVLRTFNSWNYHPSSTVLSPDLRLRKEDCDLNPAPTFHSRYRGIVGSLGYLVNMTRSDLAFAYSELSKYVQFLGKLQLASAEHVFRYLRGAYAKGIIFSRGANSETRQSPLGLGRCRLGW